METILLIGRQNSETFLMTVIDGNICRRQDDIYSLYFHSIPGLFSAFTFHSGGGEVCVVVVLLVIVGDGDGAWWWWVVVVLMMSVDDGWWAGGEDSVCVLPHSPPA